MGMEMVGMGEGRDGVGLRPGDTGDTLGAVVRAATPGHGAEAGPVVRGGAAGASSKTADGSPKMGGGPDLDRAGTAGRCRPRAVSRAGTFLAECSHWRRAIAALASPVMATKLAHTLTRKTTLRRDLRS